MINGKLYVSKLLRESYRDNNKKVKNRTIANLTKLDNLIVDQLELLLKGGKVNELKNINGLKQYQGKSYGGLKVAYEAAKELGLIKAFGRNSKGKIALLIICGIILSDKKSKNYISNYWSKNQAIEEVLNIKRYFKEDDLYEALDWLSKEQLKIEKNLLAQKKNIVTPRLFLYDITSSYVEGDKIALTKYGYNRDKKKGKQQIVMGLLTDDIGDPVSIEVYVGNTIDYKTVSGQLKKIEEDFGVKEVVFVGDRGMIKSEQIQDITSRKWQYITGITKPQIRKLINEKIFQYDLFDEKLCEVKVDEIRYILRRNPLRFEEIKTNLNDRIEYLRKKVSEKNKYLSKSKKRSSAIGLNNINELSKKLNLKKIVNLSVDGQEIVMEINKEKKEKHLKLAGCYVIKTNVSSDKLDKQVVHGRYKDLAKVEQNFRNLKTGFLEVRPIFLRNESRVRGHVFACMLALKIIRYVERKTKRLGEPMVYVWECLDKVQYVNNEFNGQTFKTIPEISNPFTKSVLNALNITFPIKL